MQKIFPSTLIIFILFLLSGFSPVENITLKVEVSNIDIKPSTKIWVSVFIEKDFLKTPIQTKTIIPSGNKIFVEFNLPPADYAISTYHDINNNNILDRYFIGKPKEPYGLSNNVKPLFGPPNYKDCKFTLTNAFKSISIALIN